MSAGTKVAHTPGPWFVTPNADYPGEQFTVALGQDGCGLRRTGDGGYVDGDDSYLSIHVTGNGGNGATEADAHLIAAAPDLLEALEVCADHIASSSGLMGDDPMVKQARTAIAKARGQS